MARIIDMQCPVFEEKGAIKITTDYGKDIPDYPTDGKTGDHWGLDLVRGLENGDSATATIVAIADGYITAQRKWVKGSQKSPAFGNCVYVKHENGMVTKYAHLKYGTMPSWIKDGAEVKKGDVLGFMGSTGYSYGAHLHFQVEDEDGNTVDPEPYLTGEKSFDVAKEYGVKLTETYKDISEAWKVAEALETLGVSADVYDI